MYWSIRAGEEDGAKDLFLCKSVIAMDWHLPDLSDLPNDREEFKRVYKEAYPDDSEAKVFKDAGTNYRFVHALQVDDYVAFPNKQDSWIYFGQIAGKYYFDASLPRYFWHARPVTWLVAYPREVLSTYSTPFVTRLRGRGTLLNIDEFAEIFQTLIKNTSTHTNSVL